MPCILSRSEANGHVYMQFKLENKRILTFIVNPIRDTVDSIMNEYRNNFECIHGRPANEDDFVWRIELEKFFPRRVGRFLVMQQP